MILEHTLPTDRRTRDIFASFPRTRRIVDVGCGIRPCPAFQCEEHICIEPCAEYRAHLNDWHPHRTKLSIVEGGFNRLAEQERADTTVLILDVIEHLERPDGERLRDLAEEFERAVIFTPLGWYEQGGENPDGWGLNGGEWQRHRSAWQPEDFKNWCVTVWDKWHVRAGGAILAVR